MGILSVLLTMVAVEASSQTIRYTCTPQSGGRLELTLVSTRTGVRLTALERSLEDARIVTQNFLEEEPVNALTDKDSILALPALAEDWPETLEDTLGTGEWLAHTAGETVVLFGETLGPEGRTVLLRTAGKPGEPGLYYVTQCRLGL